LILLAGFSGLRLGELRALRRQDVDVEAGTLRVEASIAELQDGTLVRKSVKTAAGRRTVTIPDAIVDHVRRHLDSYLGQGNDDPLFTSPTGAPFRASNFSRYWNEARIRTGLEDLHLHDLRHTSNTLAALSGASVRELMGRMGHASQRAAVRYQHLARSDHSIADAMSLLIQAASAPAGEDDTDG
jgi:integrase